jgi:hypothetical protein
VQTPTVYVFFSLKHFPQMPKIQQKKKKKPFYTQKVVKEDVVDQVPVDTFTTDLDITIETLEKIISNDDLKSTKLRKLRQLLYQFNGKSTTLSGKISDALQDQRYWDALGHLYEMHTKSLKPKLGSVCRWVRDCDAVWDHKSTLVKELMMRVLEMIIRVADPAMVGVASGSEVLSTRGNVRVHADFVPEKVEDQIVTADVAVTDYKEFFKVVYQEEGSQRLPPNKHDMLLWHDSPDTITFNNKSAIIKTDISTLPGVFILQNVLSPSECHQMITASESIGFQNDEPCSESTIEKQSVLAQNFFWMVNRTVHDTIFARIKEFMPPYLGEEGNIVVGMNCRFRVYKYTVGSVYRPHLDGAWPGSSLKPDGEYLYDGFGDRWSKLTLLFRLNDDFEGRMEFFNQIGGATTFFTPATDVGYIDATPVCPARGDCLVFPHGNVDGTILHEGSPVMKGFKYVIRTEVLYLLPRHIKK